MRGISIYHDYGYGTILKLLRNIKSAGYEWFILEQEIIQNNDSMFFPEKMTDSEFHSIMTNERSYFVYFLNLQAYPIGTKLTTIKTYNDFLNSECEIVLLISDGRYIDIYAKHKEHIEQCIENAKELGCEKIEILTDENDGRTEFRAF